MAAQQKALILLINDQATQLLLWQQLTLTLLAEYRNAMESRDEFKADIAKYPEHRVLLVADIIDENFRHDLIVHVTGADRDALIKRKLDFSFRTTRYRLGRVKGREQDGCKQDKLLLAAISKPEILDGWVEILLEEKRAIQSVTSIAWLSRSYLPIRKLDKEPTLLVIGIDPGNNLRQTFFQEGKLLFSRQTNLIAKIGPALAAEIESETQQVRQYLERIQFVQYEAPLRILVTSTLDDRDLPLSVVASSTNRFEHHRSNADLGKITVVPNGFELKANHYLIAKVLASSTPPNFYGPPAVTRYHDLLRMGSLITIAAGVLLLIGIGANMPMALGARNKFETKDLMTTRTIALERDYTQQSRDFPETKIPASEMALIVEAYTRLKSQTVSPISAFNLVSQALARTQGVRLSKLQWSLEPIALAEPSVKEAKPAPREKKKGVALLAGLSGENALTAEVLQQNTQIKLIVSGEAVSESSFREAQQEVLNFADALRATPGTKVLASKLPTDVRTDAEVTFTVDDRQVQGTFTLEVTIPIALPTTPPAAKPTAKLATQP